MTVTPQADTTPGSAPTGAAAAEPSMDELYERVRHAVPPVEWATMTDDIEAIRSYLIDMGRVTLPSAKVLPR